MKNKKTKSRKEFFFIIMNSLIILLLMVIILFNGASENNQNEDESQNIAYESKNDHDVISSSANASYDAEDNMENSVVEEIKEETETLKFSRNLSEDDKYLLAKIAMAEVGNVSFESKVYVILVVLNRVESNVAYFPDTVSSVIFQNNNGVYQFSPVTPGGRWWNIEPNDDCWKAVELVNEMEEDITNGALYFESCRNPDNWHSRNLEFLFESDGVRFYK